MSFKEEIMNTEQTEVSYMQKIGLLLEAGTTEKNMDLTAEPSELNFIYGVGKDGITLFEKALFGKCPGDEVTVEVKPWQIDDVLGHLNQHIQDLIPIKASCFLKARVVSVVKPDQREIVRAIAGGAGSEGCGCGGGCGCS
jgi:hypothetical protein